MTRLLVPVDRSDNAMRALAHAIAIAKLIPGSELCIVTAHEPATEHPRLVAYHSLPEIEQAIREDGAAILQPAIDAATAAGVKFTSELLLGTVPDVVVKHAEAKQCDGIVMGTRGMGAISNLVLGSIATKVIHLTKLPVTLVK